MIWSADVSFDGYYQKISEWYKNPDHFIGDPPIDAQYALDLIFKTLIDDKEHYPYLTTVPESTKQINSIMLDLILRKYSREYRQYLRKKRRKLMANTKKCDTCKVTKVIRESKEPSCCTWYMDNVVCGDKTINDCEEYIDAEN